MGKQINILIIVGIIALAIYIIFFGMFWISGEEVFEKASSENINEITMWSNNSKVTVTNQEDIEEICEILKSYELSKPLKITNTDDGGTAIELLGDDCDISICFSNSVIYVINNSENESVLRYRVSYGDLDKYDNIMNIVSKYE